VPAPALAELTQDAAAGCEAAWRALVTRFDPMLRSVVRGYRLDAANAEDVVQTTWIRAYQHLDRLNEPEAVGGWLAVTARREALRSLQRGVREIPAEVPMRMEETDGATPESAVLQRERSAALRAAVARLPQRQEQLLSAILRQPGVSYGDLSAALAMPTGSIGPTRERALSRLRADQALSRVLVP
jgi:RNA polymerase sigma factor (sigma-70 family)